MSTKGKSINKNKKRIFKLGGGAALSIAVASAIAIPIATKAMKNKAKKSDNLSNNNDIDDLIKNLSKPKQIHGNKTVDDFNIKNNKEYTKDEIEKIIGTNLPDNINITARVTNINNVTGRVIFDATISSKDQSVTKKTKFVVGGFISKIQKQKVSNEKDRANILKQIVDFNVLHQENVLPSSISHNQAKLEIEKKYSKNILNGWSVVISDVIPNDGSIKVSLTIKKNETISSSKKIVISGYKSNEAIAQAAVDNAFDDFTKAIKGKVFAIKDKPSILSNARNNFVSLSDLLKSIDPTLNFSKKEDGVLISVNENSDQNLGKATFTVSFSKKGAKAKEVQVEVTGYKTTLELALERITSVEINNKLSEYTEKQNFKIDDTKNVRNWTAKNKNNLEQHEFSINKNGITFKYKIKIEKVTNEEIKKGLFNFKLVYFNVEAADHKSKLDSSLQGKIAHDGFHLGLTNEEKQIEINKTLHDTSIKVSSQFDNWTSEITNPQLNKLFKTFVEQKIAPSSYGGKFNLSDIVREENDGIINFKVKYSFDSIESKQVSITLTGFKTLSSYKKEKTSDIANYISAQNIKQIISSSSDISQTEKDAWAKVQEDMNSKINDQATDTRKKVDEAYSEKIINAALKTYNDTIDVVNNKYIVSNGDARSLIELELNKHKQILPSLYAIPELNKKQNITIVNDSKKQYHAKYKIIDWTPNDQNGSIVYEVVYSLNGVESNVKKYTFIIDQKMKDHINKLIAFFKLNNIPMKNFVLNDFLNDPQEEIIRIALLVSERNIKIPDELIDNVLNLITEEIISNNRNEFSVLFKYLFEFRDYQGKETTNLKVISWIFGNNITERAHFIDVLISDTNNMILNLSNLLTKHEFDKDQLDIMANILARLPLFSEDARATISELVPFIKAVLPRTIDLLKSISKDGFRTIFYKNVPSSLSDLFNLATDDAKPLTVDQKRLLLNYFKKIYKDNKKYIDYFLNGKTMEDYVDSMNYVGDAKKKMFSKFELFLSFAMFEFFDKGMTAFGSSIATYMPMIEPMISPLVPPIAKTLNDIFAKGPFNNGDYSLRKLIGKLRKDFGGILNLAGDMIPANFKSILNIIIPNDDDLFSLIWDSIDNGIGTSIDTVIAKEKGDKKITKFIKDILKLASPSGYISGKAGEEGAINNDLMDKLIQGLLTGFKTKDELLGAMKQIIPSNIMSRNIPVIGGTVGKIIIDLLSDVYKTGSYEKSALFGAISLIEVKWPKLQKVLRYGLIKLSKNDMVELLNEIKNLEDAFASVVKIAIPDDLNDVFDKLDLISSDDINNAAMFLYTLLHKGINDMESEGLNALLKIIGSFGLIKDSNVEKISNGIEHFLNYGLKRTNFNEIKNILDFIKKFVNIPPEFTGFIDSILRKWAENDKTKYLIIPKQVDYIGVNKVLNDQLHLKWKSLLKALDLEGKKINLNPTDSLKDIYTSNASFQKIYDDLVELNQGVIEVNSKISKYINYDWKQHDMYISKADIVIKNIVSPIYMKFKNTLNDNLKELKSVKAVSQVQATLDKIEVIDNSVKSFFDWFKTKPDINDHAYAEWLLLFNLSKTASIVEWSDGKLRFYVTTRSKRNFEALKLKMIKNDSTYNIVSKNSSNKPGWKDYDLGDLFKDDWWRPENIEYALVYNATTKTWEGIIEDDNIRNNDVGNMVDHWKENNLNIKITKDWVDNYEKKLITIKTK